MNKEVINDDVKNFVQSFVKESEGELPPVHEGVLNRHCEDLVYMLIKSGNIELTWSGHSYKDYMSEG